MSAILKVSELPIEESLCREFWRLALRSKDRSLFICANEYLLAILPSLRRELVTSALAGEELASDRKQLLLQARDSLEYERRWKWSNLAVQPIPLVAVALISSDEGLVRVAMKLAAELGPVMLPFLRAVLSYCRGSSRKAPIRRMVRSYQEQGPSPIPHSCPFEWHTDLFCCWAIEFTQRRPKGRFHDSSARSSPMSVPPMKPTEAITTPSDDWEWDFGKDELDDDF